MMIANTNSSRSLKPVLTLAMQCFCLSLALVCCDQSKSKTSPTRKSEAVRTDVTPIAKRLPKLGPIASVWWISNLLSKDSALSPPVLDPTYQVLGFAKLGEDRVLDFRKRFAWKQMPVDWQPVFVIEDLKFESAKWSECEAFSTEFLPKTIPGKLYFDVTSGIVCFDLTID